MQEIWKDIEGYEGIYQISTFGRRKAFAKLVKMPYGGSRLSLEVITKGTIDHRGYYCISMCKDGKKTQALVHRLVAKAFIPNPDNKYDINHKNCNPLDNNVENLEWCTPQENTKHAYKMSRIRLRFGSDNNLFGNRTASKLVINLETGIYYDCAKDAADSTNLSYQKLKNRLNGATKNNTPFIYV